MAAIYPVGGANSATLDQYSGKFIPQLWSSKLNVDFYNSTVFAEIANTDWEGEIKGMGDKVVINNVPGITIRTHTSGAALQYEVPAPSTVELLIDKGRYFGLEVDDVLAFQSKIPLMNTFTSKAAQQLKISIDSTVLYNSFSGAHASNKGATAGVNSGSYNLGTDTTPVSLTSSNVLTLFTQMASVLDEQNVPEDGRYLIIDPATRQLLMASNLAQAQFMGDSTSIVRNGKIGMIDRFTVYVSNQLPRAAVDTNYTSGDGTEGGTAGAGKAKRRVILAGHKSAITFASQITKVETLRIPQQFGDYVRGLNTFGHKVVKPEGLVYAAVV